MNKSESIAELSKALSKAQAMMKPAAKDSENPHFRSKYADLASCWDAARGPLSANDLAVIQTCDIPEQGAGVIVETTVTHATGEYITGRMFVPVTKYDAQGIGSALTYGRRYGFCAAIGMVADEDDDANSAVGKKAVTETKPKTPAPPAEPPTDSKDPEYLDRIKNELRRLFGDDKKAALDKIEELTAFKGKDGQTVEGVRDFTKLKGKRLEILCHNLEKIQIREPGEEG